MCQRTARAHGALTLAAYHPGCLRRTLPRPRTGDPSLDRRAGFFPTRAIMLTCPADLQRCDGGGSLGPGLGHGADRLARNAPDETGVAEQVAPPEAARLAAEAKCPLQPTAPHPLRRLRLAAGDEVEGRPHRDGHDRQCGAQFGGPVVLLGVPTPTQTMSASAERMSSCCFRNSCAVRGRNGGEHVPVIRAFGKRCRNSRCSASSTCGVEPSR